MDLSTILGNLLDNSITALNNCKCRKELNIIIKYTKKRLIIRISNSFDKDPIFEDGLPVTTKSDTDRHGKGLKNVRKAAEKYNGLLKISCEKDHFIADVLLYDIVP